MYTWSKRLRLSQTERSPRATHRAPLGKRPISWLGAVFFMPLLLAGCVDRAVSGGLSAQQQEAIPDTKVIDYRTAACDTLWQLDDKDAMDNALYWLRAMDCADRIGSTQARALAKTVPGDSWSGVFKQSILLGSAQPTSGERRQMLDRINSYRMEFPGSLRPLTQLWRQQQMLQITLFDEKARYQHLQESSDSQIDSLRQSQARLQSQLQDTSRKLENLTDIERQLSSRKQLQGEIPDNSAGSQKGEAAGKNGAAAKGAESQDEPEKGTALPVEPEDTYTPHPANKESHAQ
ncbi:two-component system QseEF-associated lipoprotein QseG [Serratia marcescens]|uniref:two-component system QseEF-associated lipoprotein QseG n=1 Tax=Serratia marcescens TaxID=615 RepID=UPI000CDB692A|nr:two-component system QseEF-associated lipoprotein QseG [Serratia marcescens]POP21769.1 two-component system QseEF-associated lipoprotein QseG [Serratia marcescens]POP25444.1 two-component system QseEF-associated lipoprotein QseG [Serratia marcescens]WLS86813.1 two-component system QseEF-associated lipoprotein QseG [Serratia marcescens]